MTPEITHQLDHHFLEAQQSVGHLEQSFLPTHPTDVTVVIPTNYRWVRSNDLDNSITYGPAPWLIRDLMRIREEEGVSFDIIIVDDTRGQRFCAKAALSAALKDIKNPPNIYLLGIPERQELYRRLDEKLSSEYDRRALQFLTTQSGYGPQRVRGDTTVAFDGEVVISLDDDLRIKPFLQAKGDWLQRKGLSPIENSLVYVPRYLMETEDVVETIAAKYLMPYLEILGKTSEQLMSEKPTLTFAESTINTKDVGLNGVINNSYKPSQYITSHNDIIFKAGKDDRVGVATGRKSHIPDVNAGRLIDYLIATGLTTDGNLNISAVPSGPHTAYVIRSDTNPDCAVMGRTMDDERVMMTPWLLSDPAISQKYGRVHSPYRAEDRLFTRPPVPGLLMSSVPAVFVHDRSELGFRPTTGEAFWSEELGDAYGDIVLERVDSTQNKLVYKGENGQYVIRRDVAEKIYDKAQKKIEAIRSKINELLNTPIAVPKKDSFIATLVSILDQLIQQTEGGLETFYRDINAELAEQLSSFFQSSLEIYYPLMEASRDLRRNGQYPISVFRPLQ